MFLVSTADTSVPWRRRRLRFFPLLESRWLLNPLFLLTLPLPVTLNLLAAARLVLIFGTAVSFKFFELGRRSFRRQQHRHASPFQARSDINLRDILDLVDHSREHLPAQLRMSDFPPAKEYRDFHPLAAFDKLANAFNFMRHVMPVGARSHLDFLDLDDGMFLRPMRFFLLLVTKLSVVHHAAN